MRARAAIHARGAAKFACLVTCEHGGNDIPPRYAPLFRGRRALLASHRGYDPGALVTARALAPLDRLVGWCNPLRAVDGVILALKGSSAPAEVAAAERQLAAASLDAEVLLVRAHPDASPATVVRLQSLLSQRAGD